LRPREARGERLEHVGEADGGAYEQRLCPGAWLGSSRRMAAQQPWDHRQAQHKSNSTSSSDGSHGQENLRFISECCIRMLSDDRRQASAMASGLARPWPSSLALLAREGQPLWTSGETTCGQHPLERKAGEVGALRHAGFPTRCSPTRAAMGSAIRPPAAICSNGQSEGC